MRRLQTKQAIVIHLMFMSSMAAAQSDGQLTLIKISVPADEISSRFSVVPDTMMSSHLVSKTSPQQSLPLVFKTVPGVIAEPVFGGVDHPRLSIRGSGVQRGTQPAGRGIELRFNGVPINYADTSYDFVEWLDPSDYQQIDVIRGGRAAMVGGVTLGGVIDFVSPQVSRGMSGYGRFQSGHFGKQQRQLNVAYGADSFSASISASEYEQEGFREHNQQSAQRVIAEASWKITPLMVMSAQAIRSDSELELPGPQRLTDIQQRSRVAQPGNQKGNWRRYATIEHAQFNVVSQAINPWGVSFASTSRDIDFIRRDVQDESARGITLAGWFNRQLSDSTTHHSQLIVQHDERHQAQFFNGGGTLPTFNGNRGIQWADNTLTSSRATAQSGISHSLNSQWDVYAHGSVNQHNRHIKDHFLASPNRPLVQDKQSFNNLSGVIGADFFADKNTTFFVALSHVSEPPTLDVLLTNVMGGPNFVDNPRRPVVNQVNDQKMLTAEAGFRVNNHHQVTNLTLYHAWLRDEIVSTSDALSAQVTSVGNAKRTKRVGAELLMDWTLAESILKESDHLKALVNWNWVQATFEGDKFFGNNDLPVVTPHTIFAQISYLPNLWWKASMNATYVPRGAYADYQNTLRDKGYSTFGARLEFNRRQWAAFIDLSNITNAKFAATVIGAQNNAQGKDGVFFAPGEPRALTGGLSYSF